MNYISKAAERATKRLKRDLIAMGLYGKTEKELERLYIQNKAKNKKPKK